MTIGGFLKQDWFSVRAFGTMLIAPEAGGTPHIKEKEPGIPGSRQRGSPASPPSRLAASCMQRRSRRSALPVARHPASSPGFPLHAPERIAGERAGDPPCAASRVLMTDEPPVVRPPFEGDSMSSPVLRFTIRKRPNAAPLRADRSAGVREHSDKTPRSGPGRPPAAAVAHSRTICTRLHTRPAADT